MKGVILLYITPYSQDLATSEFHMFGPMKEALRWRFSTDEVIGAVQNWLKTQLKNFHIPDGIKELVEHWNRCVEIEGDYVQK
jgi:hypothetical protein